MATCTPQDLLTSGACFNCLTKKELQIVIAQLLCNISVSGGGGGGTSNSGGVVDPEGVVSGAQWQFYTNTATQNVFQKQSSGTGNTGWQLLVAFLMIMMVSVASFGQSQGVSMRSTNGHGFGITTIDRLVGKITTGDATNASGSRVAYLSDTNGLGVAVTFNVNQFSVGNGSTNITSGVPLTNASFYGSSKVPSGSSLTLSNATPGRVAMIGADSTATNSGGSGAFSINADGSLTTFSQIQSIAPGNILTNGESVAATFSNSVTVASGQTITLGNIAGNGGTGGTNIVLNNKFIITNSLFANTFWAFDQNGNWSYTTNNVVKTSGTGAGALTAVDVFNAGANTLVASGGSVGIGTASPQANLHVLVATVNALFQSTSGNSNSQLDIRPAGSGSAYLVFGTTNGNTFRIFSRQTSIGDVMIITGSGDVSIRGSTTATNGITSFASTAPIAITATGWTNSYTVNAVVEFDASIANLQWYVKNSAGTGVYTNTAALNAHASTILQPGGSLVITAGTSPSGTARQF